MNRRVVHVIPFLWSGAGRVVTRLCEEQAARGVDVHLATTGRTDTERDWPAYRTRLRRAGVTWHRLNTFDRRPESLWPAVERATALLAALSPDVVHAHAGVPTFVATLAARGTRVVGQMYSWGPNRPRWMDSMDLLGFSRADRVVVSAERYARLLLDGGVAKSKLAYIPWGVDIPLLSAGLKPRRHTSVRANASDSRGGGALAPHAQARDTHARGGRALALQAQAPHTRVRGGGALAPQAQAPHTRVRGGGASAPQAQAPHTRVRGGGALVPQARHTHARGGGASAPRLHLGFVGRLEPRKDQLSLVEALPFLLTRGLDVHLTLVGPDGDAAYGNKVRARMQALGLGNRVTVTGSVRDVGPYLTSFDAFVSLSHDEGQGLAVLEAMGAGVPVLARPAAGLEDFLVHERTGVWLKGRTPRSIANDIARALSDRPRLIRTAVAAARMVKRRYTWPATLQALETVYGW
jgi:glycosyltransferase involved in cell wall biosynthesis